MKKPENDKDFREQIAEMFKEGLKKEGLIYIKKWKSLGAPINGCTKKRYRGVNSTVLSLIAMLNGYKGRRWYTFNQIADKNGYYHKDDKWHLKKGSKGTWVEYWYPYDVVEKKSLTWKEYDIQVKKKGRPEEEFRLYSKFYTVFNEDMIDGIKPEVLKVSDTSEPFELITRIATNMDLKILYGGDRACYIPAKDEIHLPEPEHFYSRAGLNDTALHELGHATGHVSRLNRNIENTFGSEDYAFEELIADITACFMQVRLPEEEQIDETQMSSHMAYVNGWIEELEDKPSSLSKAISEAQRAADYLDRMAGIVVPEAEEPDEVSMHPELALAK